jgi:hypothetical protein
MSACGRIAEILRRPTDQVMVKVETLDNTEQSLFHRYVYALSMNVFIYADPIGFLKSVFDRSPLAFRSCIL